MNTNDFYGQLLGIEDPWLIENVELDMDDKRVDISVRYSAKIARCQCGT